jgi:hypothetical protein
MKQRHSTFIRLRLEELESRLAMSSPAANLNPGVLPIGSNAYGASYSEWAARWWQWAYGQPVNTNPLFDQTGAAVANGQSGHVWFLAGVINVSGTAVRTADIPTGKALFFPILNVEADNLAPPISPPLSVAELRALASSQLAGATLEADVDGRVVQNPSSYHETSPVFSVTFPNNNVFQFFGFNVPAGTYSLPDGFVDEGYYLMLAPLSAGPHTIHFHAGVPSIGFNLDITYHLNVVGGDGGNGKADPTLAAPLTNAVFTPPGQAPLNGTGTTGPTVTGQTTPAPTGSNTGNTQAGPTSGTSTGGTAPLDQTFASPLNFALFHLA